MPEEILGWVDFEFDLATPLFEQILAAMDGITAAPLTEENIARIEEQTGVYLLFLKGTPVYVGKADEAVPVRLRRHFTTLSGRKNLTLADMTFKAVCFAKTWDAFKPEEFLIRYYRTGSGEGWNNRGFGANDPGINRGQTRLKPNNFFKRFPLNDGWVCRAILPGEHNALDLLRAIKDNVPYFFRFRGNRLQGEDEDRELAVEARRDYTATTVTVPRADMTARELLVLVARSLPEGWQATITPSHMLLYKEKEAVYPEMEIVWPAPHVG
jgi:hypothetical protein